MKLFLQRWLINTLAVLVAAFVVHGISYDSTDMYLNGSKIPIPTGLIVATLVLGILNAFLRPILLLLSLPLLIFTLGLFTLVINAIVLLLVSWLLQPHFVVDSFGSAFWAALVISLVSMVLNWMTGTGKKQASVKKDVSTPPRDDGNGPVIDV